MILNKYIAGYDESIKFKKQKVHGYLISYGSEERKKERKREKLNY